MGTTNLVTPSTLQQAGGAPRPRAADRWLAGQLQQRTAPAGVGVVLWDGSSPPFGAGDRIGDLVIRDRSTLFGLICNPSLAFGEGYMADRLDIHGPFDRVVEALTRVASPEAAWRGRLARMISWPSTLSRARHDVHHHYDLGNDFYAGWLDRDMVYTCAYFATPGESLEAAQRAKLDLVCRKLSLRPGETVVEAGCGWGALSLHMARHYGVRVKAFNISREQLSFARQCAANEGLADRVEFIDDDYRNITGTYDAFVSVGMLEHVGRHRLGALASVLRRSVRRDGGRGLLHFIGRDTPRPLNAWTKRRIFPGAYAPTLAEVTSSVLAPAGMSVVDVENLRLHYARTLAHWGQRFARTADDVEARQGRAFRRAGDLYLAGSEAAFTVGWLQLFQVVFAPRESPPPSWTRESWYAKNGGGA
jgi:cyclopropane-fatty-acyl-phospholipid synthase